jgi:DHA1 family bicyclomycin/chloramphenicol resistance-like MFS transporter
LNFAGGGAVVAISSLFADGRPLPMVAVTAVCSSIVLTLALLGSARGADRQRPVAAASR